MSQATSEFSIKPESLRSMFQALAETCNAMPGQVLEDEERVDADDFEPCVEMLEDLNWNVDLANIKMKLANIKMKIDDQKGSGESELEDYERMALRDALRKYADSLPSLDLNDREKVDRVAECFTKASRHRTELDWSLIDKAYKKFRLNGYKTPPEYLPGSEM